MLFKKSVRTSKRTPHFTITQINWLTLFKFNDDVNSSDFISSNDKMNSEREFETVWKEAVVVYFNVVPSQNLFGVKISQAGILTRYLPPETIAEVATMRPRRSVTSFSLH
jgi:hypothetical protein